MYFSVFFLVAVRKGGKLNDNERISLLNNFPRFLGVEIKRCEDKIRLPADSLADAKSARSEIHVFAGFPPRNFSEFQLF